MYRITLYFDDFAIETWPHKGPSQPPPKHTKALRWLRPEFRTPRAFGRLRSPGSVTGHREAQLAQLMFCHDFSEWKGNLGIRQPSIETCTFSFLPCCIENVLRELEYELKHRSALWINKNCTIFGWIGMNTHFWLVVSSPLKKKKNLIGIIIPNIIWKKTHDPNHQPELPAISRFTRLHPAVGSCPSSHHPIIPSAPQAPRPNSAPRAGSVWSDWDHGLPWPWPNLTSAVEIPVAWSLWEGHKLSALEGCPWWWWTAHMEEGEGGRCKLIRLQRRHKANHNFTIDDDSWGLEEDNKS